MLHSDQHDIAPSTGVGIASSEYANRTRKLIALVTQLRAQG